MKLSNFTVHHGKVTWKPLSYRLHPVTDLLTLTIDISKHKPSAFVKLASAELPKESKVIVSRFGETKVKQGDSGKLNWGWMKIQEYKSMESLEVNGKKETYTGLIELHAGFNQLASVCLGDSGGPMFQLEKSGWKLAGIHSFGTACSSAYRKNTAVNVRLFKNWIEAR